MKRRVPRLRTNEQAEAFLESDLSDLDFSQFKPGLAMPPHSTYRLSDELRDFICDLPGPGNLSWSGRAGGNARWTVSLRDKTGKTADASFDGLEEALDWLREKAVEFYPDSDFARDYARGPE
jgi:hypothetical protein